MEDIKYPLFELMSGEYGLTLLDTELEDILVVCRGIEAEFKKAEDKQEKQ